MEIPGDEFAESSYGILIDNSADTQKLNSNLESISQAAMQNNYRLASIMRLFSSMSIQEKIRLIEKEEKDMEKRQQQQMEQEQQMQQMQIQAQQQTAQLQMQQQDLLNQRDNETKIKVAEINSNAEYLRLGIYAEENDEELVHEKLDIEREKLRAQIEQFDKELRAKDTERKDKKEIELKKIEAQKQIAHAKASKASSK